MNKDQAFKAGEGSGKSGAFFFSSHDNQFIIKTMKKAELRALLKILPEYVDYLKKNPYSMLAKIYGVFSLRRRLMKTVTVMLMENTLQLENPSQLLATYDLKGSTFGRESKGQVKPTTIQKDIDFINAKAGDASMFAMGDLNRKLRVVLQQDTKFLIDHGFLDYSLLLAVEKNDEMVINPEIVKKQALVRRMTRGVLRRPSKERRF